MKLLYDEAHVLFFFFYIHNKKKVTERLMICFSMRRLDKNGMAYIYFFPLSFVQKKKKKRLQQDLQAQLERKAFVAAVTRF